MLKETFKFDKSAFSVTTLDEADSDGNFWLSKTPEERIRAVEFLRQLVFGYDPTTERLQRFFETAEFKTD